MPYQNCFLANDRPQLTDLLARTICPAQQSVTMQRLQPLAVFRVRLPPWHTRERSRVHQQHLQASALHDFQHRDPVNSGALHGDRSHSLLLQPPNTLLDLFGRGGKYPHLPESLLICRAADKHLAAADIDAGYIGLDYREFRPLIYFDCSAALWFLHTSPQNVRRPRGKTFGFSSGG